MVKGRTAAAIRESIGWIAAGLGVILLVFNGFTFTSGFLLSAGVVRIILRLSISRNP